MNKKIVIILVVVVVLAIVAATVYFLSGPKYKFDFVFNLLTNKTEFEDYSNSPDAKTSFPSIKTVGFWIKLNPNVSDGERPGIIMGNHPSGPQVLNVEVHADRRPRIYMNGGAVNWLPNDNLPLDIWTHILFVIKPITIEYYRDGSLFETYTSPTTVPDQGEINNIKYGYDNRGSDVSVNAPNFQIGKMYVSDTVPTQDQITDLVSSYKPI